MKVVHVPFCFYPEAVGGTEVYVRALACAQRKLGWQAEIAAPGARDEKYQDGELPVHRFRIEDGAVPVRELYGEGNEAAALSFARILDEMRPDLMHLHAFTRGASLKLVRKAKERNVRVICTYHAPTMSCVRGTLLRDGREVCDGVVEAGRCTRCVLQSRGVDKRVAWGLSKLPAMTGALIDQAGLAGSAWTALRMHELVSLRREGFLNLMREADNVVAVCEWVKTLLLGNGVAPHKLALIRYGIVYEPSKPIARPGPARPLRIAFLGRVSLDKGIGVLIDALRAKPDLAVQLDVYGITQGREGEELESALQQRGAADGRIRFLKPLPVSEVVQALRSYDLLAVPSQWLETGPLVVYEAFAAGTPVLGSALGGIAELVAHGKDGYLVDPYNSPTAWGDALQTLVESSELLSRLRSGVTPPRTIQQAATETLALYERAVNPASIVA